MDRDSVPAIIFIVAICLVAIIAWALGGSPASSNECYLPAHPRHFVKALPESSSTPSSNDQQCVSR